MTKKTSGPNGYAIPGRYSTAIQKCTIKEAKYFGRFYLAGSVPSSCINTDSSNQVSKAWDTEAEALSAVLADPWIQENPQQVIQMADCSVYDRSALT